MRSTWLATWAMAGGSVPLLEGSGEGEGGCSHSGFAAASDPCDPADPDGEEAGRPLPVQAAPSRRTATQATRARAVTSGSRRARPRCR